MTTLLRIACHTLIAAAVAVLREIEPRRECHWEAWEAEMAETDTDTEETA